MFTSDEHLLCWIAGFFDGEGCVIVELSNSPKSLRGARTSLHATATQTSRPCLEIIQKHFGGSIKTSSSRAPHARRWAVQHTWVVRNTEALTFLQAIHKYTIVKNTQIELALTYPNLDVNGKKYGSVNRMPDEVWNLRLYIREQLQNIRSSMKQPAFTRLV